MAIGLIPPPVAVDQRSEIARASAHTSVRRLGSDLLWVGGSTAICHALGIFTSLLLRGILSPAPMGVWQALRTFLNYTNYANLGVSKAAARSWSAASSASARTTARGELDLAFTANTLGSIACTLALVAAAVWMALGSGSAWAADWAWGLGTLAVMVLLHRQLTFEITICRAEQRFRLTSRLAVFEAALTLMLVVAATWLWGFRGLCIATLVVVVGALWFLRRAGIERRHWQFDRRDIRRLAGIGLPIMLSGLAATLLRSADRLTILSLGNNPEFQLGCYSLAMLVSAQLFSMANMLPTVLYPRFAALFGMTHPERAAALAVRGSLAQAAGLGLLAAIGIVSAPALLGELLPAYRDGLPAIRYAIIGTTALGLALPGAHYLVATCRERLALAVVLIAAAFCFAANGLVVATGHGSLASIAAASATAQVVYWLLIVGAGWGRTLPRPDQWRLAALHALLLGPAIGAALGLEQTWPEVSGGWLVFGVKLVIVSCVGAAGLMIVWVREGTRITFEAELPTEAPC